MNKSNNLTNKIGASEEKKNIQKWKEKEESKQKR